MNEKRPLVLPMGLQTFRDVRDDNCYYVDKTPYAKRMTEEGKHYFLSRPRRFGKSLFLSMLKDLFEGNEQLFSGLDIYDRWDWSTRYPVLQFSVGGGYFVRSGCLRASVDSRLADLEKKTGAPAGPVALGERFANVIKALHERTGQRAVILIDEYDKPIHDAFEYPDVSVENRDILNELYGGIKMADPHIRFSFMTGVSWFSKATLFAEFDIATDITLDPRYSEICGFTEAHLDTVFAPALVEFDRDEIRRNYRGYNWLGEDVYNPWDILNLADSREYKDWWGRSGSADFLVDNLLEHGVPPYKLESVVATRSRLAQFDVGNIAPEALLFQTGYITITGEEAVDGVNGFRLRYSNLRARMNLNDGLLRAMQKEPGKQFNDQVALRRDIAVAKMLSAGNTKDLETLLQSIFDSIPDRRHSDASTARHEASFISMFYSQVGKFGSEMHVGDGAGEDEADIVVLNAEVIWIFGFNIFEQTGEGGALKRIIERGYADKYRTGQRLLLVGAEFSKSDRKLIRLEIADG